MFKLAYFYKRLNKREMMVPVTVYDLVVHAVNTQGSKERLLLTLPGTEEAETFFGGWL